MHYGQFPSTPARNFSGPSRLPHESITPIADLQPALLKFARSRLRNAALAEDAVSETVVAYLEAQSTGMPGRHGQAWLYGILRHKVVDEVRRHHREMPSADLGLDTDDVQTVWGNDPEPSHDPHTALCQRRLSSALSRACMRLPALQRQAFMMREAWGWDTEHICQQLEVSESNLWVLVHRARKRLQVLLRDEGLAASLGRRPRVRGGP